MATSDTGTSSHTATWTWDQGDYTHTARDLAPLAEGALDRAGDVAGRALLDLGTGTGNALLAAARRGAHTTGVDRAPRLMGIARDRLHAEGLDGDVVEGDIQDLPFASASFDVAISVSAAVLVPGAPQTASELVRVLRPGGRAVLVGWDAADGPFLPAEIIAAVSDEMGAAMAEDPGWFAADRVERLLAPHDVDVEVTAAPFRMGRAPTCADLTDTFVRHHPAMVAARGRLDDAAWADVEAAMRRHVDDHATEVDGTVALDQTALFIDIRRHAA